MKCFQRLKLVASFVMVFTIFCFVFDQKQKSAQGVHAQSNKKHAFACAINCMDGRVQDAVKNYMKEHYKVDYVDMVTEAGPDKILSQEFFTAPQKAIVENVKSRIAISVNHHGTKVIAIAGHDGCAGNPATKDEQLRHLMASQNRVKSFGFKTEVIILWVESDWKTVKKIN